MTGTIRETFSGSRSSAESRLTREIGANPLRIPGNQTSTVQVDGYPGLDDGGHIVANQNGGASERINIVALDRLLNQGQRGRWREMEDLIRSGAAKGREVRMETRIEYGDVGAPNRPVEILSRTLSRSCLRVVLRSWGQG